MQTPTPFPKSGQAWRPRPRARLPYGRSNSPAPAGRRRRLITALLLVLGCGLAWGAGEGTDRLHRFLDGLVTLQAEFSQVTYSADHGSRAEAEGTFYLHRPGRFRWVYRSPQEQIIIADGGRVWLHDLELDQVTHQSQEKALRGTPALVLSETDPIETHFSLRELGERDGRHWLELRPKAEDSEVERIQLAFDDDRLETFEMEDSFGQITRFRFLRMVRNPRLEPDLFRFRPPPGIDLLEAY